MSERPVGLNLSTSSGMRGSSTPRDDGRAGSDEDTRRHFEALLHAADETGCAVAQPSPPSAPRPLPIRDDATDDAPRRDLRALRSTLAGLFVGEGQGGKRQTAMQLADDVLPGVVVTVYEDGGAWVADFACADDDSRELLCAQAGRLVREMADQCARRSGWRVMTDDDEDLRLREFWADPTR